MNDQELVKWARVCAGVGEVCENCPFDGDIDADGRLCADRILLALSSRVETLGDRCARYAEEIAVMQARERWISVEEALPEGGEWVLCLCTDGDGRVLCYNCVTDVWDFTVISGGVYAFPRDVVTHWRPLPKGPKEVEAANEQDH